MSFTTIVILVAIAAVGIWAYSKYKSKSVKTVVQDIGNEIEETFEEVIDKAVVEFKEATTKKAKSAPKKAVVKKATAKTAPKKVANKAAVVKVARTKKKD